jgi:hypothetical protein
MITQLISALSDAFTEVVGVVTGFFGQDGVFGAIGDLSSNIF